MVLHWEQKEEDIFRVTVMGRALLECPGPRMLNVHQCREEGHIPRDSPTQNDSSAPTENIALRNKNRDKGNPVTRQKAGEEKILYKKAEQVRNNKMARKMSKHISNLIKCN